MSTKPIKIMIEMTPTGESTFHKEFMKSQENMKQAFELDLKDAKKRNDSMNSAYGHLFGEPAPGPQADFFNSPTKRRKVVIVGGGAHIGKQAVIDMIAKIKKEMISLGPCISHGNMLPHSVILDSCTTPFEIKGSDFAGFEALPGIKQAREALIQMGQCGINAGRSATNLARVMKEVRSSRTKSDDCGVSYKRKQANHWANKYSHKIRRKL